MQKSDTKGSHIMSVSVGRGSVGGGVGVEVNVEVGKGGGTKAVTAGRVSGF
jgi:hypothetical protein